MAIDYNQQYGGLSVEQQRMADIKKNAGIMKGGLANKGRCPICTLKPPCKHYASMEALNLAVMQATG